MNCKLLNKLIRAYWYYVRGVFISSTSVWFCDKTVILIGNEMLLSGTSCMKCGANSRIENCKIELINSSLIIQDNVHLKDVDIVSQKGIIYINSGNVISEYKSYIAEGSMTIGINNILEKGENNPLIPCIRIHKGNLSIGNHNVIRSDFWIRFLGCVTIGNYNCINEKTEVRCDEKIDIGSYNLISYDCNIWDTNTHSTYTIEERRSQMENDFPDIGAEKKCPKTVPVFIGDYTWIGKRANILKGTHIEQCAIVGIGTTISGKILHGGEFAVSSACRIIKTERFSDN